MSTETIMGTITFINHDKGYATIEYMLNGKKKTINGNISENEQLKLKAEKIIKKIHSFHVGDEVSFVVNRSARGDKLVADCIEFKFNNAYNDLINKAAIENRFVGYLKKVGEDYFVKETGSYILFPLKLSPWERMPPDSNLNEPFFFKLENIEKQGKATAAPFKSMYIPEYMAAMQYYRNKTPVDAIVDKTTPHGVFIKLLNKIQAKLPVPTTTNVSALKAGDKIKVRITYLSSSRIVVEQAS